eukprot:10431004-Ditylum_brightwellii.AAC.1
MGKYVTTAVTRERENMGYQVGYIDGLGPGTMPELRLITLSGTLLIPNPSFCGADSQLQGSKINP